MSGGTLYASNGKEQFTSANPAIVQLANGADPTTGVLKIKIDSTDVQLPVQIQSRLNSLVQTHNNVLVAPNTSNTSSGWVDCSKFDKVSLTLMNDASVNSLVTLIWSHDQSTYQGEETLLNTATGARRSATTDVKASYVKVFFNNSDASAHTISTWLFLKA